MKSNIVLGTLGALAIGALTTLPGTAAPLGSVFTYQGRLANGGSPARDGLYDFRFRLHDAATAGSPIGSAVNLNAVPVSNGVFTAQLDFGATPFTSGEARWLELSVNTNGVAPLATLNPRQRITPTPQAIYAENAALATSVAAGAVTSAGIAPSAVDSDSIQNGSIEATDLSPSLFNGTFWKLGGNASIPPGLNFLGSLGFTPLELRANNQPVLRLQPNATSPNILGGHPANGIAIVASGAFIGGGGATDRSNVVTGNFTTIVGGHSQRATADGAFIGGGAGHTNSGPFAMIGGGAGHYATRPYAGIAAGASNQNHAAYGFIGGGAANFLTLNSDVATIGGGTGNTIVQSPEGIIGGGHNNRIEDAADGAVISGGSLNSIQFGGLSGAIGGGTFNFVNGAYATVGGGLRNAARNQGATIAGGSYNTNAGLNAAVGGGSSNIASGAYSGIASGIRNTNQGDRSFIGGGSANSITEPHGSIGGGEAHHLRARHGTIGGGLGNEIGKQSDGSTIGGGAYNEIGTNSFANTLAGGSGNRVGTNSSHNTIGGGQSNEIGSSSGYNLIGGGVGNEITGAPYNAVIGGGYSNTILTNSDFGIIGGGDRNIISNAFTSTISGGRENTALEARHAVISGGELNQVSDTWSTVPGGYRNSAKGSASFAAGNRAKANHDGAFVWSDSSSLIDFASTTNNQFAVRSQNGVMIQATATAVDLRGGGALRVAGAGIGTTTPVFVHRATAANIANNYTRIDHPHCNGNPNAILIVTQNYNPGNGVGTYNNSAIGVFYDGFTSRWAIFNENTGTPMPVNAAFNVMVFKP